MIIRKYQSEAEGSDGRDEGGYFKTVEVPDISKKLQNRMKRCGGCHHAFYNGRANITGNYCWSLNNDNNFKKRGTPKCWVR
jgi:hypothetical protein